MELCVVCESVCERKRDLSMCEREKDMCVYVYLIVCVGHSSAHLLYCFLMNYAYIYTSGDAQK